MRYPTQTRTKVFCDTITTSIARYEKYRCWASKSPQYVLFLNAPIGPASARPRLRQPPWRSSIAKPIVIWETHPEGPKIEKIQPRDASLKNSRFQSRNETFDREWFFQSDPSLAAEKQGLGLKFSIENEIFKPRMKISSENDFSCVWEWFFQAIERE